MGTYFYLFVGDFGKFVSVFKCKFGVFLVNFGGVFGSILGICCQFRMFSVNLVFLGSIWWCLFSICCVCSQFGGDFYFYFYFLNKFWVFIVNLGCFGQFGVFWSILGCLCSIWGVFGLFGGNFWSNCGIFGQFGDVLVLKTYSVCECLCVYSQFCFFVVVLNMVTEKIKGCATSQLGKLETF